MAQEIVNYDRKAVLGRGISAQVFSGNLNGEKVAVKKILKRTETDLNDDVQNREEQTMKKLDHPNVLKLIEVQHDMDFKYLILELCVATVRHYIKGEYTGKMPTEIDALIQMASGLAYIHSQHFVHRDIKPENVLISESGILKISDFGFCRPVTSSSGSFSMSSGPKGTRIYNPPEFFESEGKSKEDQAKIRANVSIDIFSLGCLFFSYLTLGCHPFANNGGSPIEFATISNIRSDIKVLDNRLSPTHYAYDMIDGMTKKNPDERWKLDEVLETLKKLELKKKNNS